MPIEKTTKETKAVKETKMELVDKLDTANIQIRDLEASNANLTGTIEQLQTSVTTLGNHIVKVEKNLTAIKTQRDRLLNLEADALVDLGLMEHIKDQEIKELRDKISTLCAAQDAIPRQMAQMESDLQSARQNHGRAQSEKMKARKAAQDATDELLKYKDVLAWFHNFVLHPSADSAKSRELRSYFKATPLDEIVAKLVACGEKVKQPVSKVSPTELLEDGKDSEEE